MSPRAFLLSVFVSALLLPVPSWALSFEEAMAKAYQTNPGLQAQRAKLRVTEQSVDLARSGYRPVVEGTAAVGKSEQVLASGGAFVGSGTLTPRDAGITITQPVFKGFRTVNAIDAAQAQTKAQASIVQVYEQKLLLDAAKAYLDAVQAQSVLELNKHNEDVLAQQLEATETRFKAGEVTKTDVSQAQARLSVASAGRVQSEGELANAHANFMRLIGEAPKDLRAPTIVLEQPRSLEQALEMAAKANPEIVAATYADDAAKANLKKEKGSLLPEVNLVASASRGWDQSLMVPNRQDNSTIMARMTIPLYRAGADFARIKAGQETAVQSGLELDDARLRAREAVMISWQALATARAAIKAHQAAVAASDLALQGVKVESQVGQRTTLDVLNAEQEALSAKVSLVKAQHDEAMSILQVKAAIGILTPQEMKLPL